MTAETPGEPPEGVVSGAEAACRARIRPMRPVNETEIVCGMRGEHAVHQGTLRDYAYPGSETLIEWRETDRRSFRGLFIPCGDNDAPCLLPQGHGGRHQEG